jgi:hypothetical protein
MASSEVEAKKTVVDLMNSPTRLTTKRGLRRPLSIHTGGSGCSVSSRSTSRRSPSIISTPEDEAMFRDFSAALTITSPNASKNKFKVFTQLRKNLLPPSNFLTHRRKDGDDDDSSSSLSSVDSQTSKDSDDEGERFFSRGGTLAISRPSRVSATTYEYNHDVSSGSSASFSCSSADESDFLSSKASHALSSQSNTSTETESQHSSDEEIEDDEHTAGDSASEDGSVAKDGYVTRAASVDYSLAISDAFVTRILSDDESSIFSDAFVTRFGSVDNENSSLVSDAFVTMVLSNGTAQNASFQANSPNEHTPENGNDPHQIVISDHENISSSSKSQSDATQSEDECSLLNLSSRERPEKDESHSAEPSLLLAYSKSGDDAYGTSKECTMKSAIEPQEKVVDPRNCSSPRADRNKVGKDSSEQARIDTNIPTTPPFSEQPEEVQTVTTDQSNQFSIDFPSMSSESERSEGETTNAMWKSRTLFEFLQTSRVQVDTKMFALLPASQDGDIFGIQNVFRFTSSLQKQCVDTSEWVKDTLQHYCQFGDNVENTTNPLSSALPLEKWRVHASDSLQSISSGSLDVTDSEGE